MIAVRSTSAGVSTKGRPCRDASSASSVVVSNRAAAKSSCATSQRKNGSVVRMPRTSYSSRARRRRAIACVRSLPHAASFEIIES